MASPTGSLTNNNSGEKPSSNPSQIPHLKKSSIFGPSSASTTAPLNSFSSSATGSSILAKGTLHNEKLKLRSKIPIYGSNGKMISPPVASNVTITPTARLSNGTGSDENTLSSSLSDIHNGSDVSAELKKTDTDSVLTSLNSSDLKKESAELTNSFKEETIGVKLEHSSQPDQQQETMLREHLSVKAEESDDTDAENEHPVPTHKGRRLIRKMEYADLIQNRRERSTNSDDGVSQHEQIHVAKRKQDYGSDSNNSRSSSPSRKRNFSAKDALGRTKLQKCCIKGKYEMARDLIRAGANVNQPDHAGNTPLHEAALNGHYDIAKLLIDNGAKVNVQSGIDDLDTPLIDACAYNHLKVIELLLENGADPTLVNASGQNAMDSIDPDENGAAELTKLIRNAMKEFGAPVLEPRIQHPVTQRNDTWIDLTTKEGREEIYHRAAEGDEGFVGNYLANGGKPHPKLLIFAARHGHSNVVSLLLAFGAKIEKAVEGESALMQTVGRGHFDTVKMLLDNGANPTRINNKGTSVLDRAKDPNLVTDPKEISLLEEAIKNYKSSFTSKAVDDANTEEPKLDKLHSEEKVKERRLKRKTEIEEELNDLKSKRELDHEDRKRRKRDKLIKEKTLVKVEGSDSGKIGTTEVKDVSIESTPVSKESTPVAEVKQARKKMDTPPQAVASPPVLAAPVLTAEEEEAKRIREAELLKQREQWEQHKRAQREAKAADIMRSIEENRKRREEEEKRLELKKKEELELKKKREEEEKLEAEKKLKQGILLEEIERRKVIREYYVPGLKNATFNSTRTVEDALLYLPLYVVTMDEKDYVVDLQVTLLLGLETFRTKYSNLLKDELTESEKNKLWRFFFPMIGYDKTQVQSIQSMEKSRIEGLGKFQLYQMAWILLEDVEKILQEEEFKHLQKAIEVRWITRIELEIDENLISGQALNHPIADVNLEIKNGVVKQEEVIKESSIPYKFRGNKKFLELMVACRKKNVF